MSKKWVKEELHHGFMSRHADACLTWIVHHRDHMLGSAIAVAAAGLLVVYLAMRHNRIAEAAEQKFFVAQQTAAGGGVDAAIKQLDSLATEYPRADAASYGSLLKADLLFETGRFKEAADTFSAVEKSGPARLTPFAMSALASSKQAMGDYMGSVAEANRFLDRYSDHFLAQQVYTTLAVSQELAGRKADAEATYKKLEGLFPGSYGAETAKAKLTAKK
ncbi:MAG: tetratricopeptide repeat protein [Elusimicrobiales bacterium]